MLQNIGKRIYYTNLLKAKKATFRRGITPKVSNALFDYCNTIAVLSNQTMKPNL